MRRSKSLYGIADLRKKKEDPLRPPWTFLLQEWPLLQNGWTYASADTCQAARQLPMSLSWLTLNPLKRTLIPHLVRRSAETSLCSRLLAGAVRPSVRQPSCGVRRLLFCSAPNGRGILQGYTDPATLQDWWANDAHHQWAWQWDFFLQV